MELTAIRLSIGYKYFAPAELLPAKRQTPNASRNCPVFLRYNKVVTLVFTGVNWANASPDISFPLVVYRRGSHRYADFAFTALLGSIRESNDPARAVQPTFLDLAPRVRLSELVECPG